MPKSTKWRNWITVIDFKTCKTCRENNGKIYNVDEEILIKPPVHYSCRCIIDMMNTIVAGTATHNGVYGADLYLKKYEKLPDYYITKYEAKKLGWIGLKGNLSDVAPNKMIFGGIYYNDDGKLPHKEDRIWYEADINYENGFRNGERILFSNDGLIFVTYNHYETFYEIE